MGRNSVILNRAIAAAVLLSLAVLPGIVKPPSAAAGTFTWNANASDSPVDGGGIWSTGSNWWTGTANQPWNNAGDMAVFGATAGANPYTVTLGATVSVGGLNFQSQDYTIASGTITLSGTTPAITVSAGSAEIDSIVAGSAGLLKSGGGLLTLANGGNSYAGGTIVSQGTLNVTAIGGAGSGTITLGDVNTGVNNVQLTLNNWLTNAIAVSVQGSGTAAIVYPPASNNFTLPLGSISLNGPATFGAPNLNGFMVLNSVLSGSGALSLGSFNGQRLILNGASPNYTGDFTVGGNALFDPRATLNSATGNNVSMQSGGALYAVGPVDTFGTVTIGGLNGSAGTVTGFNSSGAVISLGKGNSSGSYSGTLSDGTGLSLIKAGTGQQIFAGTGITYAGPTLISGGTLELKNATGFASTSILNNATLKFDLGAGVAQVCSIAISGSGNLVKSGSGQLFVNCSTPNPGPTIYSSSYTGGTTVSCGSMTMMIGGTLGSSNSPLSVETAQLNLDQTNQTVGAVRLDGGAIANGVLNASSYNVTAGTVSASLQGGGPLIKTSTGTLVLGGANTYGGGTTIHGGTVVLARGSAAGLANPIGYKIVAAGDSITMGNYVRAGFTIPSWTANLQNLLGGQFAVYDEGNNGLAAMNLTNPGYASPYTASPQYPDALAKQPNVVVIQLGTNDSSFTAAQINANYVNDLTSLVNTFKNTANHPSIFLCLPPEIYDPGTTPWYGNGIGPWLMNEANLDLILPMIQQVATATGATLIDNHTPLENDSQLFYDGVHPNTVAQNWMGQNVYNALASTFFANGPLGTGPLAIDGGALDLAGHSVTVPSFSGAAGKVFSSGVDTVATLNIRQFNSTTFCGSINDGNGLVAVTLQGGGKLVLSGSNTFTGGTEVQSGILIVPNAYGLESGTNLTIGASADSIFAAAATSEAAAMVATSSVPEPGPSELLSAAGLTLFLCRKRRP
jgi:fibronectin-binding autotransporter adhesin